MKKYPVLLQDEEKACGAYCIAMILQFYGFQEELREIKKKARLNQNGISMKGMIECFKSYQIETKAYEASLQDIQDNFNGPCILYMIYQGLGHFVVLYEIKEDAYIVGDPAKGLVTLYEEEMNEHYALRFIQIVHVGRVPQLHYQSYFQFLKQTFESYRPYMRRLIGKGLWISLLGYVSSYFFQFLIDDIQLKTQFFYMVALCASYGLIELIRTRLEKMKTTEMISLRRAIDEDYVFASTMSLLELPQSFFYQEAGHIHAQISSLFELSEMSLQCYERIFLDGLSFMIFMIGMFVINIKMSLLVFFMLGMIAFTAYYRLKKIQELNKNYLENHYLYQQHVLELIENQFLIKRFSLLQKQRERSYHIYLDEALAKQKQAMALNQLQSLIQYIMYIFYTFILITGFYAFKYQHLTMGQLMMFYMLVSYCLQPVLNIVTLMSDYQQMSLIYEKYKAFQKEESQPKDSLTHKVHSITLDNMSYAYGYQLPILEHLDLKIEGHLLLQGKTGCGKSTLLKLLMGFDLNYTGDIYINDQELRTIDLHSLYQHMGYTNETPSFLHMSLFDNFLCSDEKKIQKYLKAFGQKELIDMMHLILSEDGSPLSLGQRQVVALIRVLCQDYDVLILDEAFSHMDSQLAQKVIRYLLKNDEGKIYIIVNHQTKIVNRQLSCAIIEEGKLKSKG